jgi:uncharacterized repeat protein (TIGR01451 family)
VYKISTIILVSFLVLTVSIQGLHLSAHNGATFHLQYVYADDGGGDGGGDGGNDGGSGGGSSDGGGDGGNGTGGGTSDGTDGGGDGGNGNGGQDNGGVDGGSGGVVIPPSSPLANVLTVSSVGVPNVSISSDTGHGGITNYSLELTTGTNVVLVAPTINGHTFLGWSGDCVGVNPCVLTITSAENATANYDALPSNTLVADLLVSKHLDKSVANVGDTVTYTITLVNNGPDGATGVSAADILPSGLNFVSATTISGSYATTTGVWTVGNLANNSSAVLTLMGTIASGFEGKTITNSVVVSGSEGDPSLANNTASIDLSVNGTPICTENCGGGGGSSGSGSGSSSGGSSRPATVVALSNTTCFYLRDYLRRDFNNDPLEVMKLQAFLKNFEGHNNVVVTGIFDQATFDAVSAFQMKYFKDILEPWGHTGPTGYVYILTLKKINEIYCQRLYPLDQAQINEIAAFKSLLESLRARGINTDVSPTVELLNTEAVEKDSQASTTPEVLPVVGYSWPFKGQNIRNLAAVLLAVPPTLLEVAKCLYWFILVLIILCCLGHVLKNVFYIDEFANQRRRFTTKWLTIVIGLVCSLILFYILHWWCLLLPLIITLIIALIWWLTYSKHYSMRAYIKSWYLVVLMRIKSVIKNNPVAPSQTLGKDTNPNVFPQKESVIILSNSSDQNKDGSESTAH